jgi:hypothetical protein
LKKHGIFWLQALNWEILVTPKKLKKLWKKLVQDKQIFFKIMITMAFMGKSYLLKEVKCFINWQRSLDCKASLSSFCVKLNVINLLLSLMRGV